MQVNSAYASTLGSIAFTATQLGTGYLWIFLYILKYSIIVVATWPAASVVTVLKSKSNFL